MHMKSLLFSAALVAALVPAARSQALHGEWFKVTISAEGRGVQSPDAPLEKEKLKPIVRYAQFILIEGVVPSYTLSVYSPNTLGGWITDGNGTVDMIDFAETFVVNGTISCSTVPLTLGDGAPNIIEASFNGPVTIKTKDDVLKSAKITTLGGLAYLTNDSFATHGKSKVTFKRIDAAKLPFEPVVMATAGGPARAKPAIGAAGTPVKPVAAAAPSVEAGAP